MRRAGLKSEERNSDEPGQHKEITYEELLREVSRAANVLKDLGVKKGDVS